MKIVAVRIGDRYGPEYETYLESKLPEYEFVWIRQPMSDNIKLQWNKMHGMTLDTDEPICVMDIDVLLINDYQKIFEYPIERGQFVAMPGWWRDTSSFRFSINGGFYKYYPKDCEYILDKFMKSPEYWQRKYIQEGYTSGPINGEQHFIEDSVNEGLQLVKMPDAWFCRMEARQTEFTKKILPQLNRKYNKVTGNPYMFMGDEFYPEIKFVHFTHMMNHPSKWTKYHLFV